MKILSDGKALADSPGQAASLFTSGCIYLTKLIFKYKTTPLLLQKIKDRILTIITTKKHRVMNRNTFILFFLLLCSSAFGQNIECKYLSTAVISEEVKKMEDAALRNMAIQQLSANKRMFSLKFSGGRRKAKTSSGNLTDNKEGHNNGRNHYITFSFQETCKFGKFEVNSSIWLNLGKYGTKQTVWNHIALKSMEADNNKNLLSSVLIQELTPTAC